MTFLMFHGCPLIHETLAALQMLFELSHSFSNTTICLPPPRPYFTDMKDGIATSTLEPRVLPVQLKKLKLLRQGRAGVGYDGCLTLATFV